MFKNLIILSSLSVFLFGCYQPKTHGKFLSEQKDAWIDGYSIRIDEHKQADKGLVFCRANLKEDGSADPVCYQPKFKEKK